MLPIIPAAFKLVVRTIKTSEGPKTDPAALKQLEVLRKLFRECDKIVVATDAGREGELIFRYIYDFLECRKPFERLWISSLTDKAIGKGFEQLRKGADFDNLYYSAKARREADWLVGINASQALTLVAARGNYSLGRVQTPTLAMICRRYRENQSFVPKTYLQLQLTTEKDKVRFTAMHAEKFRDSQSAHQILSEAQAAKSVIVQDILCKEISQEAPLLHDLTSLQREANTRLGFSADKTLGIAQSLYEKQLISYPRTGSRYISQDIFEQIPVLLGNLKNHMRLGAYAIKMEHETLNNHCVDDTKLTDHHALIITENVPQTLSADQSAVYELIAGRMLESFSGKCVKTVTSVTLLCNEVPFHAKGIVVKVPGWRAVFGVSADSENEEVPALPPLIGGEQLPVVDLCALEKKTKPAPLYTEASLLAAMESAGRELEDEAQREAMKASGLGTPATRAGIIEILLTRNYIERQGKSLVPTAKGLEVYEIVREKRIADIEMTGMWELALGKISAGEIRPVTFSSSIDAYTRQIVSELLAAQISPWQFAHCVCPKCHSGQVHLFAKVAKCDNPDCGLTVFRQFNAVMLSDEYLLAILNGHKTPYLKFVSRKTKKPYQASLFLDDEYAVKLDFKERKPNK